MGLKIRGWIAMLDECSSVVLGFDSLAGGQRMKREKGKPRVSVCVSVWVVAADEGGWGRR